MYIVHVCMYISCKNMFIICTVYVHDQYKLTDVSHMLTCKYLCDMYNVQYINRTHVFYCLVYCLVHCSCKLIYTRAYVYMCCTHVDLHVYFQEYDEFSREVV